MQTRDISKSEAIKLAQQEESHFLDRKARSVSGVQLEKLAVAFSNSDGGEVLIGIKDDSDESDPAKRWEGFEKIEDCNGLLQCLFNLTPSLDVRYEVIRCLDFSGFILRVIVEKSGEVARTSANDVYQRQGAQSLKIKDPDKISALGFAKGASSYEDTLVDIVPPDVVVDAPELGEFLAGYAPKTDPLDFCVNRNLLEHNTWRPRVAGLLLFHPSPSTVLPKKCSVRIARYETREDDPERDHLANTKTLEGPLYSVIQESVTAITTIMSSVKLWAKDGLKTVKYPPEAIWETVVNAIIHRDYSISDDVQILIFDNRIEIRSPGRLPGYVRVDNILEARYSRNPKIVGTLSRYSDPPNKDLGEGLNTTFQKMKEFGLQRPIVAEDGNYVSVTLPHKPLATPSEAVLGFLEINEQIMNRQARDLTGIKSENAVKQEFYKLRDAGLIERVPELRGTKSAWRLTDKGKAHIRGGSHSK
ncbi:MAG: ATP-binding protein [Pseudomonadota bacterium]